MTLCLWFFCANILIAVQGVFNVFLGAMLVSQSCIWTVLPPPWSCTHHSRDEHYACVAVSWHDTDLQKLLTRLPLHYHDACLVPQGGSIFSKIRLIVSEPSAIPEILGSALTTSSNFFIDYVIIQVTLSQHQYPMDHLQGTSTIRL